MTRINLSNVGLIGLGNVLLGDERVGVYVAKTIEERYVFSPEIEIIDGGTLGLDLLPIVERFEKVLFVDAVNFGKEPGYIGVLEDEGIPAKIFHKLSVHHIGLADLLSVAKLQGVMPKKVCLIGIQIPPITYDFGLEFSKKVSENVEKMIDVVIVKLKEWNIECVLQCHQK